MKLFIEGIFYHSFILLYSARYARTTVGALVIPVLQLTKTFRFLLFLKSYKYYAAANNSFA
jgi:hypothetical protein